MLLNISTHQLNMNWECAEGHRFQLRLGAVRNNNRWCRKCAHDRFRLDISAAHEAAEENDGECLSATYTNLETPLRWKCHRGHAWEAPLRNIRNSNRTWCPKCRYKSESACREILEEIFDTPFPKKRLREMEYLELDGYSEEFGIAFEYNGLQHEQYVPHFHRNGPDDFWEQRARDERKRSLCEENGIVLVEVPPDYNYRDLAKLREYITSVLAENGL